MFSRPVLVLCAVAVLAVAPSCGGGDDGDATAPGAPPSGAAAPQGTAGTVGSAGQSTSPVKSSRAGSVDVCALLSADDAADVSGRAGLGGGPSSGTTYALTSTKQTYSAQSPVPTSGCKFNISASSGGSVVSGGTVVIEVVSADQFSLYKGEGTPVRGLGDEAVSGGGTTVVRIGDLMLQTSENSFTEGFVVDLYRKMAPKLK